MFVMLLNLSPKTKISPLFIPFNITPVEYGYLNSNKLITACPTET